MKVQLNLVVAVLWCSSSALASYDAFAYSLPKYYLPSRQTYGKPALKSPYASSQHTYADNNDGYGYQTRTTYIDNNKYHIPKPQYTSSYKPGESHASRGSYGRSSYYKQATPGNSYHETPFKNTYGQQAYGQQTYSASSYKPQPKKDYTSMKEYNLKKDYTRVNDYGTEKSYSSHGDKGAAYGYQPTVGYGTGAEYGVQHGYSNQQAHGPYDPCSELPEGDYALQAEFQSLYPGVDSQCNFVKCANHKAYVNPCSIGTKNDDYGGPHEKWGFCAQRDYGHYCGVIPPANYDEYAKDSYDEYEHIKV